MTIFTAVQLQFETGSFLALFVPGLICLGSAFFAADLAESRARSIWPHLLAGFALPVFWPLYIRKTLLPPAEEAPKNEEFYVNRPRRDEQAAAAFTVDLELDAAYFRRIWRTESGEKRGPFRIETEDNLFLVQSIAEIQEKLLVVDITGRNGELQRIRIPFEKIVSCTES